MTSLLVISATCDICVMTECIEHEAYNQEICLRRNTVMANTTRLQKGNMLFRRRQRLGVPVPA